MARLIAAAAALAALAQSGEAATLVNVNDHHHHHHHEHHDADGHHKHHHHHAGHHHKAADVSSEENATAPDAAAATPKSKPEAPAVAVVAPAKVAAASSSAPAKAAMQTEEQIMSTMKRLDKELSTKEKTAKAKVEKAQIKVNGPLPQDFSLVFSKGVAQATGASPDDVRVVGTAAERGAANVDDVVFEAKPEVVKAVRDQAANPDSKLANGPLHIFLVAKDDDDDDDEAVAAPASKEEEGAPEIDSAAMPFGDLEPFGREDTAQELTESSIHESDTMVDQLERAEVAEEKRAVFRALTRLRGAAITSYDGIARSQTGNIDEYARKNQWRKQHPVRHLAQEESDTKRWAFPEASDF